MLLSGILPVLAPPLRRRGPLAPPTAELVAEPAQECELLAVLVAAVSSPVLCNHPLLRLVPAALATMDQELLPWRAVSDLR